MEVQQYVFKHREPPSVEALAQRLSTELYTRRFFPYYTFNILAGVSEKQGGRGVIYSYDAIGNTEQKIYGATGSASSMMLSVLDMGLDKGRRVEPTTTKLIDQPMGEDDTTMLSLSAEDAVKLGVDALTAATERNIETGDSAEAWVISLRDGVVCEVHSLRKD